MCKHNAAERSYEKRQGKRKVSQQERNNRIGGREKKAIKYNRSCTAIQKEIKPLDRAAHQAGEQYSSQIPHNLFLFAK
jgi:hypothetical protein